MIAVFLGEYEHQVTVHGFFGFVCRWFNAAPKVQYNIAQGNALGFQCPHFRGTPKEQYNRPLFILPFQGEDGGLVSLPSPLGWAMLFWPFRPEYTGRMTRRYGRNFLVLELQSIINRAFAPNAGESDE